MNTKIRHLNIEVTKRCNQRCFYCFNNSGVGSPASELTLGRWLNIVRALQQKGLESIHLTGGEPFAYKHAVQLLEGAQGMNLSTSILSNGFRVEALARAFPDVFSRLAVAQFSLDSMNEEIHNQRRGYRNAWRDAINAIRALRDLFVPVEVSCVVSETNLMDIQAVADFCRTVDAGLIIRPILAAGRAAACRIPDSFTHDLEICVQSLTAWQNVRLVTDRFHYVADEQEIRPPQWPTDVHTVHHDGRVRFNDGEEINLMALTA